ncbi:MAG TPA: penicillin-binding protein 2 [Bacillota bacterium]|nr:penicillin-binding protein 2 [Bacillota bacterium]
MSSEGRHFNKRRIFGSLLIIALVWFGLIGRLLWIQILGTRHFSSHNVDLVEDAVAQRKQEVILHTGRGDILDRKGEPLTGREVTGVAIFPLVRGMIDQPKVEKLAQILGQNDQQLLKMIQDVKEPTFIRDSTGKIISVQDEDTNKIEALKLPGILPLPITERYQPDGIATQLIGYISQNPELIEKDYGEELNTGELTKKSLVGVSGLERSFQRFLQGVGPTSVSYYVDGKGNPLNGLKPRLIEQENQFYPLSLVTTIDKDLQRKIEKWMDESGIATGAVVVMDTQTREVLAMASHPDFHPVDTKGDSHAWVNHAIKQTIPGSIFKTVVAAAVLEEGLVKPDDKFFCEGKYGKYGFSCWKEGGHGEISFAEAYAQSCNITFAKAALKLPPGKIEEYAKKLGLAQQVGWEQSPLFKISTFHQFSGEDTGQIFSPQTPKEDEGVIIQTAIGQRDVQMTPLQAANMMATVADDGNKKEVRVVKEIRYKTGTTFHTFEEKSIEGEGIDRSTDQQLKKMMELVVKDGTGKALQDAKWKLAGKSGTAQIQENGEERNNQWFIGYGPADKPRYAVAVVDEKESVTSPNRVIPIFKQIMDELASRANVEGN